MLEQGAKVFAPHEPEERAPSLRVCCELEVDERRAARRVHEPVGFLCRVVVGHARAVKRREQAPRLAEVAGRHVAGRLLHRSAI